MSCVMQAKSAFLCVGGECFYNLIMAKIRLNRILVGLE